MSWQPQYSLPVTWRLVPETDDHSYPHLMVIIVDALDECDYKEAIAEFIEILLHASQDPQFPLSARDIFM
jgi:hypothetical protein